VFEAKRREKLLAGFEGSKSWKKRTTQLTERKTSRRALKSVTTKEMKSIKKSLDKSKSFMKRNTCPGTKVDKD